MISRRVSGAPGVMEALGRADCETSVPPGADKLETAGAEVRGRPAGSGLGGYIFGTMNADHKNSMPMQLAMTTIDFLSMKTVGYLD